MMKKKRLRITSLILSLLLISGCWMSGIVVANAADTGITSETVEEREISLAEYREILINDGLTPSEADAKINSHVVTRGPVVRLYEVVKTKRKQIKGSFYLECRVHIYVWRDANYGNMEIDHAAAPSVNLVGPVINSSYSGNQSASCTTSKVTVVYNGQLYFTVNSGVSVGFGSISASTSTTTTYSYGVSGSFIWTLAEV